MYVLVDDQLRIVTVVKQAWRARVTTVCPRQGHYAADPRIFGAFPAADISLGRVGDLLAYEMHGMVSTGDRKRKRS